MAEITNTGNRDGLIDQLLISNKNQESGRSGNGMGRNPLLPDQLIEKKNSDKSNKKQRNLIHPAFIVITSLLIISGLSLYFFFPSITIDSAGNGIQFGSQQNGSQYFWAGVNIPKPTDSVTETPVEVAQIYTETQQPAKKVEITPIPTRETVISPTSTFDGTYVVQSGDTLFKIANNFGITVNALAYYNSISNQSIIYKGQKLEIPPSDYVPVVVEPPQNDVTPPQTNDQYILVDISEQHLYAYESGELVFSFVASTGMNNSTRVGVFSVLDKIPNAYGANWDIWMPNWLGIYWSGTLENGIHALPILPNGSRLWAGYLGTPISYGCVVLGVNESQLLYDWVHVGTTVEIQW
jgi:LysM repeat protein